MKRRLLMASALTVLACGSIFANKTAEEVRIYLNPGHGSWSPNDRPLPTIGREPYNSADVDTTGFFESNTNLHKCFSILDELVEAGVPFDRTKNQTNDNPTRVGAALDLSQHIVMSHVKAGPYPYVKGGENEFAYNRNLSEIREEVEANNFDIFISVHSNAASEGTSTNYPLYLYRGTDSEEACPGSRALAEHIWPYGYSNEHQTWSYYSMDNKNVRGDISFYGSSQIIENNGNQYEGYLGVLLHSVPGFLVEGYFHTYQPARQRAMNDDVCRLEGHLYARGLINYMGWKAETTGEIYGIVRDLHEKFSHQYYTPAARTDDQYKPLNGVTVTLSKDGQVVKTYTTDNEWNGAFIFTDLEPGEYTLSYAAEGYKEAFEEYLAPVTVKANETSYVKAFLEAEGYEPPAVVYENYPDLVNNPAFQLGSEYNFTQTYVDEAQVKDEADVLAGKTVRRTILRDNLIYTLAVDENRTPYIYVFDADTKALVKTLNTTDNVVVEDGNVYNEQVKSMTDEADYNDWMTYAQDLYPISDIGFTADGVLVACNKSIIQFQTEEYGEMGTFRIYKWDNLEEGTAPTIWYESKGLDASAALYAGYTGETMAVSGSSDDCNIFVPSKSGWSNGIRIINYNVADGSWANMRNQPNSLDEWGEDFQFTISPRGKSNIIVDSKAIAPIEYEFNSTPVQPMIELGKMSEELCNVESRSANYFKYSGRDVMVAPTIEEGKSVGVAMFDITDGLDKAQMITTANTNIDAAEAAAVSAMGRAVVTTDDYEVVTDAQIELYVSRDGKISKFTTAGTEQPTSVSAFARNLTANVGDGSTEFTFNATFDAPNANVIFKNATSGEELGRVALGAVTAGENTFTVENTEIPAGEIAWAIEVENVKAATPAVTNSIPYTYGRGVYVNNNPASKTFGTIYASNSKDGTNNLGIYVYAPDMTEVKAAIGNTEFDASNSSSPFRLGMMDDGTLMISDWSDAHGGLFLMDPETYEITNFFDGDRDATGQITNNGTAIGGGTTGSDFCNGSIYTFCEDYPAGNAGNKLLRYDVGEAKTWNQAPTFVYDDASKLLPNTNVHVVAAENGFWASQTRYAGNNTGDVPALIYVSKEGSVLYNSGKSNGEDLNGCNGSGFGINAANNLLAIADGDGNIVVYDLTWNEGTPALAYKYKIASAQASYQLAFDYANNLYVATQGAIIRYALPGVDNTIETPAEGTIMVNESSVENVAAEHVAVYPNPAVDVVNIEMASAINSVAVYSVSGAAVNADVNVNGNKATINVSGLTSGLYIAKINNTTVRFIKK